MKLRSVLILVAGLLAACGNGGDAGLPTVDVVFGSDPAALTIKAEVAATAQERSEGLMGRTSLAPNTGMLFVFRGPVRVGFFMKDTLIPLDIAFIGRGIVLEVRSMVPCKVSECPVTYPSATYEMALEVAAGTFARAGIGPGTTVSIEGAMPLPSPS